MKKLTKDQQLNLIEGFCLLYEDGYKNLGQAEQVLSNIYRIVHLNGTCKNNHKDWHEEGFELGKELKRRGICNFNKKRP